MATPLDYIPKIKTGVNAGGLPPALLKQTAASLGGALRGELPEDVQNLLRQQAAEYGVASGMPGSQFQSYAGLRNLGLTSLDRIQGAERLLAPNFISPGQAQQLNLQAGTARAGLAQDAAQLAQQKELEQARLAQQGTEFSGGQALKREEIAQRGNLAALEQSGANYRAALGLGGGSGGSRGGSRGGFTGGTTTPGFADEPGGSFGAPVIALGTGSTGGASYDYGYNNPSVITGVPYDGGSYDDSGFTNYDDVIDYYGY